MTSDLVWYISYGSNLLAERFSTYLTGGLPPGRTKPHVGARDSSRWKQARPFELPHRLLFAGTSTAWGGGGVAFIDPLEGDSVTLGRGYLIGAAQFQDVLAQESGREVGTEVDLTPAVDAGSARLGDGRYDCVVYLGETAGWPMFTFTTPRPVKSLVLSPPSPSYTTAIVDGLRQSHGLSEEAAHAYVDSSAPT